MLAAVQNALSAIAAPVLSREERWTLEQNSDRALCDAIALFAAVDGTVDDAQFQLVQRRDQLAVHRAKATRSPGGGPWSRLIANGFIHGKLEDVTSALYCDHDDDLLIGETLLSGAAVLDAAVLDVTEQRSPRTPFRFAGVKWYALQCRGRPSDLLTFERMGVTLAQDNTEVAYHVVHTIGGHHDWPSALQRWSKRRTTCNQRADLPEALHRLETFTLCYLYRRVSSDLVQCFIVGDYLNKPKGDTNLEAILVDRMLMVTNTVASHEAKRLAQMVEDCRETPAKTSRTCLRCRVSRSIHDPLRVCGICRKSVCKKCRVMKVVWRLDSATRGPDADAFCVKCLRRADISSLPSEFATRNKSSMHDWYYAHANNWQVAGGAGQTHRESSRSELARQARRQRHIVEQIPEHKYNYDELLRGPVARRERDNDAPKVTKALSAPAMVGEEESKVSTPRDSQRRGNRQCDRNAGSFESLEKGDRRDLFPSGESHQSARAEREYMRHLHRRRTLDMEDPRATQTDDKRSSRRGPRTGTNDSGDLSQLLYSV
ncbi:hypothetical protein PINS_up005367 [Pythium insidiosum]|nr:hypothetical protein PINS_up005367 [Pythium insidiosum]